MSIEIKKNAFQGLSGALADIQQRALWPTTYATAQATAAELHWHSENVFGYVISGDFYLLDANGERYDASSGDFFHVPAETLHAEGDIQAPVEIIIALEIALPMDQFLLPRPPAE